MSHPKTDYRWIKGLNIKSKMTKSRENNVGRHLGL